MVESLMRPVFTHPHHLLNVALRATTLWDVTIGLYLILRTASLLCCVFPSCLTDVMSVLC